MLKKGWKNSGCMCVFMTPRQCLEGGGRVRRKGEKVDTHFRPSKDERKRLLDGEKKEGKNSFVVCFLSIQFSTRLLCTLASNYQFARSVVNPSFFRCGGENIFRRRRFPPFFAAST